VSKFIILKKQFDNHSEIIGKDRFYCVNYEELTEKPQQVMQNISIFYRKTSISNSLEVRHRIKKSFFNSNLRIVSDTNLKDINSYFSTLVSNQDSIYGPDD
jgi:ABC-type uncharacterized transport system substrate-binding protein